jgi:hypothetical protein
MRRPRSRRAAVPVGLVLAAGGAVGAALAGVVAPAGGGHLSAVSQAMAAPGIPPAARPVESVPVAAIDGLRVERVTYARADDTGGTLDVFVSAGRTLPVLQVSGEGFRPTRLRGDHGHYQARIHFSGDQAPLGVTISTSGGGQRTERRVEVDDRVYATAVYDVDSRELTIHASSSDTLGRPRLRAKGYGGIDAGGVLVTRTDGTPANVRVISAAGGAATVPVSLTGRS